MCAPPAESAPELGRRTPRKVALELNPDGALSPVPPRDCRLSQEEGKRRPRNRPDSRAQHKILGLDRRQPVTPLDRRCGIKYDSRNDDCTQSLFPDPVQVGASSFGDAFGQSLVSGAQAPGHQIGPKTSALNPNPANREGGPGPPDGDRRKEKEVDRDVKGLENSQEDDEYSGPPKPRKAVFGGR